MDEGYAQSANWSAHVIGGPGGGGGGGDGGRGGPARRQTSRSVSPHAPSTLSAPQTSQAGFGLCKMIKTFPWISMVFGCFLQCTEMILMCIVSGLDVYACHCTEMIRMCIASARSWRVDDHISIIELTKKRSGCATRAYLQLCP